MRPFVLLSAALAVAQVSFAQNSLSKRLDVIPSACTDTCAPAVSTVDNCDGTPSCMCTSSAASSYSTCIDCVMGSVGVNLSSDEENVLQSVLGDIGKVCSIASLITFITAPGAVPTGFVDASTNGAVGVSAGSFAWTAVVAVGAVGTAMAFGF